MMKIAILGATSHIAKNLVYYFRSDLRYELFLFARNQGAVHEFLKATEGELSPSVAGFDFFPGGNYDAVINCVGIADPQRQKNAGVELFRLTERFDDLILDYLAGHEKTVYINFSSGAVYGTAFDSGVESNAVASIAVNGITPADYYRIAKLNAEAKHRAMADRNIIDLRVFGFFSRFIDLKSGFLLAEMICCVIERRPFHTNTVDIVRDYVAPRDLFSLVKLCVASTGINQPIDVFSAGPVRKSELIALFSSDFGLETRIDEEARVSPTGAKLVYYSANHVATSLLNYLPALASRDVIHAEACEIMAAVSAVGKP
jgi:nucleoside-diphosphate-sugar epimerase